VKRRCENRKGEGREGRERMREKEGRGRRRREEDHKKVRNKA